MSRHSATDAFTLNIVHNALISACEEMFTVTARTAKSPIIYDVLDFSAGLTDPEGNVTAQAISCPVFVGVLDFTVKGVLKNYGRNGLRPGDVIILNDPYISGTHLNDVAIVMPVFFHDTLIAFAASKGHWNDIGGITFGSWGPGRTEIYQEGLQIPCCKVYAEGKPNADILEIIKANCRIPEMSIGDMEAQVAGVRVAARRIGKIIDKYGLEAYFAALDDIRKTGEQIAQKRLSELPKGRFHAEDFLDEGGEDGRPLPVHVDVEITENEFKVDFTGNSPQLASSLNNTYPGTAAAVRVVYMALIDPHARYSQGLISPLKVIAAEGTIFNAVRPAPVSVYWEVLTYAADLVWKALAPHVEDRLTAGHFLSVVGEIIAGSDDATGEPFALVEPNPGGWGAGPDKDGESGLVSFADGETFASSVEVVENRYPLLVERYAFNTEDRVGHGRHRGGFGIIKDYRVLNSSAELTTDINRAVVPPWSMDAGLKGTLNHIVISSEGKPTQRIRKISAHRLHRNDIVSIRTGSGGGWGDPLDRDPSLVLGDIREDFLSSQEASEVYGVVVDDGKLEIDQPATIALRESLRRKKRADTSGQ
jgi:N-methylhydantoinase B